MYPEPSGLKVKQISVEMKIQAHYRWVIWNIEQGQWYRVRREGFRYTKDALLYTGFLAHVGSYDRFNPRLRIRKHLAFRYKPRTYGYIIAISRGVEQPAATGDN